jgi:hypothetical protein
VLFFSDLRAHAFVRRLDLGLDVDICFACLGIVALEVDRGDPARIWREARRLTPDLWAEGLREPAFAAVRQARERGVHDAGEALADLERNGPDSAVARAIVVRLADELSRRARTELRVEAAARHRLRLAPPQWN